MISELRKILSDIERLAAECDDAVGAHEMVEVLDDVMRNDFRLVRQAWDAKRKELLGTQRVRLSNGATLYQRDTFKEEWLHDQIAERAAHKAMYTDEGERDDDIEAVASRGIMLMRAIYVTPSTAPRSEGLRKVGYEKKEAASKRTPKGTEVKTYVPKAGRRDPDPMADLDDGDDA